MIHLLITALLMIPVPGYSEMLSFDSVVYNSMLDYIDAGNDNECKKRLLKLTDLKKPENIAFFDALGKPISGLTVSNFVWMGNYELCLALEKAELYPCKTSGVLGTKEEPVGTLVWTSCLPLDCKDQFIDIILDVANKTIQDQTNKTLPPIENSLTTICHEPAIYDVGAYVAIVIISIFITMTIIGTAWGPITHYMSLVLTAVREVVSATNAISLLTPARNGDVVLENSSALKTEHDNMKSETCDQQYLGAGVVNKTFERTITTTTALSDSDVSSNPPEYDPSAKSLDDELELANDGMELANGNDSGYTHTDTHTDTHRDTRRVSYLDEVTKPTIRVTRPPDTKTKRKTSLLMLQCLASFARFAKCWSLRENMKILLDTKTKPGQILCLNGIRVMSIGWVLLGHIYLIPLLFGPIGDAYQAYQLSTRTSFELVLNGFPAVDSFFLMSGFLVSYLLIRNLKKGARFSKIAVGYYVHRYIRLTVPFAIVILAEGFLYRQFVTGPFRDNLDKITEKCAEWWWTDLLYVNNFLPWSNPAQCIGQAWYLANDMQFYVVAPLFVLLLFVKPWLGNLVCWGAILSSMILSGVMTWVNDYASTVFRAGASPMFADFYTKPYIRIVPYLVGIFGGWAYNRHEQCITNFRLVNPLVRLVVGVPLWVISIAIQYGVVFGVHGPSMVFYKEKDSMSVTNAVLSRLGWALALLVQIVLCQAGMGGVIGKFLSWRGWLPLSRLTYSLYLLHYGINIAFVSQFRHAFSFKPDLQMVIMYMGLVCFINCTAALLFLVVEQPTANVEKLLLSAPKPPLPASPPLQHTFPSSKPRVSVSTQRTYLSASPTRGPTGRYCSQAQQQQRGAIETLCGVGDELKPVTDPLQKQEVTQANIV